MHKHRNSLPTIYVHHGLMNQTTFGERDAHVKGTLSTPCNHCALVKKTLHLKSRGVITAVSARSSSTANEMKTTLQKAMTKAAMNA